ncbi:MAG: RluA family pseudouridine synthase [Bacteroidaceae bacterium]|jgi:23S rRNA pseudouridine1911/1915/1917 synthase|nr:RluA family pseudouridine synthase [Bacteroidaceae bacterium]MBQ5680639.1 RluA family pseudouridine synthase [Bacteroidaceae bacterium]MBR0543928.1 RluA family pseudouridine synthase [Bacteroidaceae bacterium]MEE1004917.1 RluA family pseudouridine synthase [Bacteroidaceae bacterium]MEE1309304.1 RluA family pseudouridine synthase [Bacteroidaceae bacterium]
MKILYEDNHLIAVRKRVGDIVQGDKTGDVPLSDMVKNFLKDKYQKPGNVYLGVVHRLDRPVSGIVLFAKTSKALPRLNKMFAEHKGVKKTYLAIVANKPSQPQGTLTHWLTRNEKQNTARAYDREVPGSKKAVLDYRLIAQSERYFLLEIELHTGRHHQIRCQLSKMGCPIRGDLKYGAPRSNPDGGISLHAWRLELEHPVSHQNIVIEAPLPEERLWQEIVPTHK